ncbi:predicted protein [Culex quinquefasciatus]|uniref:Predicted protein n=1 Tax=Culex quinquefasciatus TaxID=7176 RepID=B0X180_CULQU|nr:predicted protein [Culex quinquefasciatus]|eukprot:XP_001863402.1 predicted protein [Culex quinquefasciatus]
MKFLAVFVTFCVGCCLAALDQQQLETMNGFTKACFEELNIPAGSDFPIKAMQGKMTTFSDQHIDFIVCVGRKYGVLNEEGRYNAQLVKEIFLKSNTFDRQQVEEVVDLCYGEPKGTTLKENVAEATKCFFANKKFKLM